MTSSSTGAKPKPVLDEGGFQQLLAAAYVLQQHNDSLHAKDPRLDAAWIFSQISETETAVRQGKLALAEAGKLVGERLCGMTGAVSASVCLLHDGHADCLTESGVAAQTLGRSLAAASPAAQERLRNGRQFQSLDAQSDRRLDGVMCRELGVRSLLAVPIQNSGGTAGLIEVRWGLANAIHECDVRTCRLMAGLLAEVIGRDDSTSGSESALPRQAFFEQESGPVEESNREIPPAGPNPKPAESPSDLAEHCRVCGRPFSSGEAFCGHCSIPRVAASATGDGLQSKWASMWFMQQAKEARPKRRIGGVELLHVAPDPGQAPIVKEPGLPIQKAETPAARAFPAPPESLAKPAPSLPAHSLHTEGFRPSPAPNSTSLSDYSTPGPGLRILEDKSAHNSEPQTSTSFFSHFQQLSLRIKVNRRKVALAVCSLIALLFLASWLSWPAQPSSHLSWFESLLVDLGLAEVPARRPPPVYAGNPEVRVWEDVHTALYYCPDSDLYGKTPGGRFSTQRSAQEDQFEPATRVACQ